MTFDSKQVYVRHNGRPVLYQRGSTGLSFWKENWSKISTAWFDRFGFAYDVYRRN